MKQIAISVAAVAAMCAVAAATVGARPSAAAAKYSIHYLRQLTHLPNLTIAGVNAAGDVVGTATLHGRTHVLVLLASASGSPRLIVLGLPKGCGNMTAVGINASGVVAADCLHGSAVNGTNNVAFVARFKASRYIWLKLPQTKSYGWAVTGIAADGDVSGIRYPATKPSRGVVWVVSASGAYGQPRILEINRHYKYSEATGIWSAGSAPGSPDVVVGGEYSTTIFREAITVWSGSAYTPAMVKPHQMGVRAPDAIGGWGTHVYMAGRIMGVDTGQGWYDQIRLTAAGLAAPGPVTALGAPPHIGVECFYGAAAVTAGPNGNFIGAGSMTCISNTNGGEAVIWHGANASNLQKQIPGGTGWRLTGADAINLAGDIVAPGAHLGHPGFVLLTPNA